MKRMTALIIITAAALWSASCGGDTTAPQPTINPDVFVGDWKLSLAAAPGCWAAGPLWFRIGQDDVNSAASGILNIVEVWSWTEDFSGTQPLIGNIPYEDGPFERTPWQQAPTVGGKFSGTSVSAGRLSGTFRDMGRAFSINAQCEAAATATKNR